MKYESENPQREKEFSESYRIGYGCGCVGNISEGDPLYDRAREREETGMEILEVEEICLTCLEIRVMGSGITKNREKLNSLDEGVA